MTLARAHNRDTVPLMQCTCLNAFNEISLYFRYFCRLLVPYRSRTSNRYESKRSVLSVCSPWAKNVLNAFFQKTMAVLKKVR